MCRLVLALPFALLACDSPTPAVGRWEKATLDVGGMTFGVHWNGEAAEAYRTSFHLRPQLSDVAANAALAIEKASGCAVRSGSLGGDHAIIKARLDCPQGAPAGGR